MKLSSQNVSKRLSKKNLVLNSIYKNAHEKIKVVCTKCEEGQKPYYITAQQAWNRGCKYCNLEKKNEVMEKKVYSKRRLTNSEFKNRLHPQLKLHGFYRNNDTPVNIECLICGNKKKVYPSLLLKGKHNCFTCGPEKTAKKRRFKVEKLDRNLKKRNLVRMSPFLNKRTPIKIKCLNCDTIFSRKSNVTRDIGCKTCHMIQLGKNKKLDHGKVKDILSKKSIKLLSTYKGIMLPGKFKCLDCGYVWKTKKMDGALYVNKGCDRCSKRYNGAYSKKLFKIKPHLKNLKGRTYLFKCRDNNELFHKIGITRQVWRERIRKIPYDVKIIDYYSGPLPQCVDLEIDIKKEYKKKSYRPLKYFGGVAECFKLSKKDLLLIRKKLSTNDKV